MFASEGFSLSVERLEMAAAHTADFIARLRALDGSGLGASSDSAVGDPRVARELNRLYRAWFTGIDVLINDGQLMAEHLAATAHSTERVDRQLAEQFTRDSSDPAGVPPVDDGTSPGGWSMSEPVGSEPWEIEHYQPGRIDVASWPEPREGRGGTGASRAMS